MLKEVLHFVRHAPGVARLSFSMSHAELFDLLMERSNQAGFTERRATLAQGLSGKVMEIGCGTGMMFPHYASDVRVFAIEPSKKFLARATERARAARATISLQVGSALDLPFGPASFDAVVIANVLCSVPSVSRVLEEVARVLRPGGEARLVEHVVSQRAVAHAAMHLFNPLWRLWNQQGCNMNREVLKPLREAGFAVLEVEAFQNFARGVPAFPSVQIRAEKPASDLYY